MGRKAKFPPTIYSSNGFDWIKILIGPKRYKKHTLGESGSPESRREYARVIAEIEAIGVQPEIKPDITIVELAALYADHVKDKDNGHGRTKRAIKGLVELYGHTEAVDFGPRALKTLQAEWGKEGLSRRYIRHLSNVIRYMFRWAAEEEILDVKCYERIAIVKHLKKGEHGCTESERIEPVPMPVVEATLEHLPPILATMVRFQLYTGARPGEVCALRPCDLNRTWREIDDHTVWLYSLDNHKSDWRGKNRWIPVVAKAQEILAPYLDREPTSYCFSPRERKEQRHSEQRERRKSKVQPSQVARESRSRLAIGKREKEPGESYTTQSYCRAIRYVTRKHGIEDWTPNQLRHLVATIVEVELGREDARCVLGHTSPTTTAIYAESVERAATALSQLLGGNT